MNKKFKPSEEFVVGKHGIRYLESKFLDQFKDKEFKEKPFPTFQKLPRAMNDTEIESELEPGLCDLGDILAFLDNAPTECKDGNWNLFYTKSFVVSVYWLGFRDEWFVSTWGRGVFHWRADRRVFSSATEPLKTKSSVLGSSETLELEKAIEICKKAGLKITKE